MDTIYIYHHIHLKYHNQTSQETKNSATRPARYTIFTTMSVELRQDKIWYEWHLEEDFWL